MVLHFSPFVGVIAPPTVLFCENEYMIQNSTQLTVAVETIDTRVGIFRALFPAFTHNCEAGSEVCWSSV